VKAAAPATNAVPAAVPVSVFVVPTTRQEGRDPFFPKSDRMLGLDSAKPGATPQPAFTLILNGVDSISGHLLAMINGRTFAAGEEGEVPIPAGRMHIRCVEIRRDSVIVEFGGQRRELRMKR
jgi:hypothetical protein